MTLKKSITNLNYGIDVDNVGKYGTFCKFMTYKIDGKEDKIDFDHQGGFNVFKSSKLECDNISLDDKIKALKTMRSWLLKKIEEESKEDVENVINRYKNKYGFNELNVNIGDLEHEKFMLETSEESPSSSEKV